MSNSAPAIGGLPPTLPPPPPPPAPTSMEYLPTSPQPSPSPPPPSSPPLSTHQTSTTQPPVPAPPAPPPPPPNPRLLEVPLLNNPIEAIEINLDELETDGESLAEVQSVFKSEKSDCGFWIKVGSELWRRGGGGEGASGVGGYLKRWKKRRGLDVDGDGMVMDDDDDDDEEEEEEVIDSEGRVSIGKEHLKEWMEGGEKDLRVWKVEKGEMERDDMKRKAVEMIGMALKTAPHKPSPAKEMERISLVLLLASWHLSLARSAPKIVLGPMAREDHLPPTSSGLPPQTKDEHLRASVNLITEAENLDRYLLSQNQHQHQPSSERYQSDPRILDIKGALCLYKGQLEEASKCFEKLMGRDNVLPSNSVTQNKEGISTKEKNCLGPTSGPGFGEEWNLGAMFGKARIHLLRRQPRQALKIYQQLLLIRPNGLPDPRVGIGICCWQIGDREKAWKAWERGVRVHPGKDSLPCQLLLGLSLINTSKNPTWSGNPTEAQNHYAKGVHWITEAFKLSAQRNASAAAALGGHFLTTQAYTRAIKLAERAIQYADSPFVTSEAQLTLARAFHAQDSMEDAQKSYENNARDQIASAIAVGQMFVLKDELPAAVNAFENVLRRAPRNIEALVNLAAVRAREAFSSMSVTDATKARKAAKETYEQIFRIFDEVRKIERDAENNPNGMNGISPIVLGNLGSTISRIRGVMEGSDLYAESGRLWSDSDLEKSLKFYRDAVRLKREQAAGTSGKEGLGQENGMAVDDTDTTTVVIPPPWLNNIGVLEFKLAQQGSFINSPAQIEAAKKRTEEAQRNFEEALMEASKEDAPSTSTSSSGYMITVGTGGGGWPKNQDYLTPITYNLAVIYEAQGEKERAREAYYKILERHPEYLDAKARLALMYMSEKQYDRAHELLKQALQSQEQNLEIRALYTHFLMSTGSDRLARDFCFGTFNKITRHDVHASVALGIVNYNLARENKSPGKEAAMDRMKKFLDSAELFERALRLDSHCAYAAQGIAIALAEGTLPGSNALNSVSANGAGSGGPGGIGAMMAGVMDPATRARNTRDALNILTKVRETLNDGSVFVNIGHCHFNREEWERAIESYETASKRFYQGKNVPVLLYLARSWFHKATKDQSFSALQNAQKYAQSALELAPKDMAIMFNIAIIQQKGLEILFELPPTQRSLDDIRQAMKEGEEAQQLFATLSEARGRDTPFNPDLAHQRRRYGGNLLNRAQETVAEQERYEREEEEKQERNRMQREQERERGREKEREKLEQMKRRAEMLAEERRKMQADMANWNIPQFEDDDEDESGKKKNGKRKKKSKLPIVDGDDLFGEDGDEAAVESKRARKKRKTVVEDEEDEEGSDVEMADGTTRTTKSATKGSAKKRKSHKEFKSKEIISDSDEE